MLTDAFSKVGLPPTVVPTSSASFSLAWAELGGACRRRPLDLHPRQRRKGLLVFLRQEAAVDTRACVTPLLAFLLLLRSPTSLVVEARVGVLARGRALLRAAPALLGGARPPHRHRLRPAEGIAVAVAIARALDERLEDAGGEARAAVAVPGGCGRVRACQCQCDALGDDARAGDVQGRT